MKPSFLRTKKLRLAVWFSGIAVLGIYLFAERPAPLVQTDDAANTIPIEIVFRVLAAENDIARGLYTKDIVGAGVKSGFRFSENWREPSANAGPLPALFLRESAGAIQKSGVPLGLFLGSDFPIAQANMFSGKQEEHFRMLRQSTKPEFFYAPDLRLHTAMFPDIVVAEACATCHNEHAKSPKTDWKLGDIMGATTWSYPKQKVSLHEALKIVSAFRQSIAVAYDAYLKKASGFERVPEIGERWPKDGAYLPSKNVFIREMEQRASRATLASLLAATQQSGP
jgi:adenylate cyclase